MIVEEAKTPLRQNTLQSLRAPAQELFMTVDKRKLSDKHAVLTY